MRMQTTHSFLQCNTITYYIIIIIPLDSIIPVLSVDSTIISLSSDPELLQLTMKMISIIIMKVFVLIMR